MAIKQTNGVFYGRTLVSTDKKIGGARHVFVPIGGAHNELVFAPFGGKLMNPFKGAAKLYAGDLFWLDYDDKGENPKYYCLKTYEAAKASTAKTVTLVRDGYHHIPFVGDVLMVAPDTIGGAGAVAKVTDVVKKTDTDGTMTWELTVDVNLTITKGDILVEGVAFTAADSDGNTGSMLIKKINGVAPYDYDFVYNPAADPTDNEDFENARYHLTPVLGGRMYTYLMSPMPKCVRDLNTASINGWFEVGGINGFL